MRGKTHRNRLLFAALLGILAAALAGSVSAQGKSSWTLDEVLKELDREAKSFRGITANIEKTKVTVVVNDRSTELGQIVVRHDEKMLMELTQPDPRIVLREGDKLFVFNPKTKRLEEYNLGKHRVLVDQFLLLGFGSSGHDLKKGYLVTLMGEQTLDKKRVLQLELTPKSAQVRNQVPKIHIWIDLSNWTPMQQKFFETGGDYLEIRYSNLLRNPKIPDSRFKNLWPKDVTKIKPQG